MKELLKLQNISFELMDFTVFDDVNAKVQQGDIIGVIGKNGAGKSTLLQLINNGLVPMKGQMKWLEQKVKITLVEQESASYTFKELTLLEAALLAKWHVPDRHFSQLSGGEKLKARLANGFSMDTDLLLLDETTNHLDMESTYFLCEQIKNHKGTIILVSHDRYLLDAIATKIWSIEDKKLIEYKRNYSSFLFAFINVVQNKH